MPGKIMPGKIMPVTLPGLLIKYQISMCRLFCILLSCMIHLYHTTMSLPYDTADPENALSLILLIEIEQISEADILSFQSVMHFSEPTQADLPARYGFMQCTHITKIYMYHTATGKMRKGSYF